MSRQSQLASKQGANESLIRTAAWRSEGKQGRESRCTAKAREAVPPKAAFSFLLSAKRFLKNGLCEEVLARCLQIRRIPHKPRGYRQLTWPQRLLACGGMRGTEECTQLCKERGVTKGVNFLAHSSVRRAARLSLLQNDRAVSVCARFFLSFFLLPHLYCVFFKSLFSIFAFYSSSIVRACSRVFISHRYCFFVFFVQLP